jgi:hypothetical protein
MSPETHQVETDEEGNGQASPFTSEFIIMAKGLARS